MKLLKSIIAISIFMAISTSSAQSITDKWKQLSEFHELLNQTFKPCEDGDFKPLKLNSQELFTKVEALEVAKIPTELKSKGIEEVLTMLKNQTKNVNELVKSKAPNAEIMRAFENVHDIYNRLVYLCEPSKK